MSSASTSKTSQSALKKTVAGVFIVESLRIDDEKEGRYEGRILRDILTLSGKKTEYWYVRTWKELEEEIFQRFWDSGLRYLHISCHGSADTIALTLDNVSFEKFGDGIREYLSERRLFMSACEVVNQQFHDAVFPDSNCYSLIGPDEDIRFDDAVIIWASFYHLMLRDATGVPGDIWTSSYERDFVSRSWTWHEGRSTQLSRW
jgi:hypothetical protein